MSIPTWGRVTAAPHQFLIHLRRGKVRRAGHGQTCFKWPGDSVALVPTSIVKLTFMADQVTREKVGVEVSGLAVYRVADPLLAYRMIDGDLGRLTEILREMFVGATRRIVATLSLEECIAHRKDRVARALVEEIAPVLAGNGELSDATTQGWGVVLDTIEIQNVRVLSEEVFQRLQAPYREALALEALRAREGVAEEQARIAVARKRAEEQARREMMLEEERRLEAEDARERRALEGRLLLERRAAEASAALASERLAAHLDEQRRRLEVELAAERERIALRREQGEMEAELARLGRASRGELSASQLEELMLTETLPQMAAAFRGSFDRVNLTAATGGGADLFAFLSSGLEQVVHATRRAVGPTRGGAG